MRAVSFNVTIPSFLIGKGLGGLTESASFGGLSGVRFGEVSEPSLPAGDWVRLEILKAGICGTDIGTLTFKASPAMEPQRRKKPPGHLQDRKFDFFHFCKTFPSVYKFPIFSIVL